jgi:hypothetical protein
MFDHGGVRRHLGYSFPLIINDLRPQKTASSKEVAQCQAQALGKCLV